MQRAIALAKKGAGFVNPNPMVGCVVVKDNEIITVGFGISPNQFPKEVADYHRRKGISPCPEDICKYTLIFK